MESVINKLNEIASKINQTLDTQVNSWSTDKILDERKDKSCQKPQQTSKFGVNGLGEINSNRNQEIHSEVVIESNNKFNFTPDMIIKEKPQEQGMNQNYSESSIVDTHSNTRKSGISLKKN